MVHKFRGLAEGFLFLAMALLAVVAVSAFVWVLWPVGWRGEGAAAWVQAVGSIGAIVGAFAVASYQAKRQESKRQMQELRDAADVSNLVVAVAVDAIHAIQESTNALKSHSGGARFVAELDRLEAAETSLRAILPNRVPASMVHSVLQLLRLVTYSSRALRQRNGSDRDFKAQSISNAEKREGDAWDALGKLADIRNAAKAKL